MSLGTFVIAGAVLAVLASVFLMIWIIDGIEVAASVFGITFGVIVVIFGVVAALYWVGISIGLT